VSLAPEVQTCMVEQQAQTFASILTGAVVSLADRMQVRGRPKKRVRVRHGPIEMAQAANAREAWLFAIRNETPLNTFVTVHWDHAPAKLEGLHLVKRNGKLRDGLKAWVYRNAPGVPFAWIEVREKTRALGEHVHLFVHVPDHLREGFTQAVDRLVALQSASVSPTATKTVPVGPKWWDRFAYVMKGGTDEVRDRFMSAEQRARPGWGPSQGTIEGARVRIAHSIGPMARKAAESAPEGLSAVSAVA